MHMRGYFIPEGQLWEVLRCFDTVFHCNYTKNASRGGHTFQGTLIPVPYTSVSLTERVLIRQPLMDRDYGSTLFTGPFDVEFILDR